MVKFSIVIYGKGQVNKNYMISIKAKINQDRIEKKINKIIQESGIDESRIKVLFDYDTLNVDIMYDDNILIDTMNLTNYIDVEMGWC